MKWVKDNWLWLLLGGGALYLFLFRKGAPAIAPRADDTPGTPEFEIRAIAAGIARQKGWQGSTEIWKSENKVRVIFSHAEAGKMPEIDTFNSIEDALEAAKSGGLW